MYRTGGLVLQYTTPQDLQQFDKRTEAITRVGTAIGLFKNGMKRKRTQKNCMCIYLIGELERQQLESVRVLLPKHHGLRGLVPAAVQLLAEHHLADDGVGLALLHVEHLAQRRQAERLVVRRVREEVRAQSLHLSTGRQRFVSFDFRERVDWLP